MTPYRIANSLDVSTRFFLAPINTGLASAGEPTSELLAFHRQRAGHCIGVAYVGNVAIHPEHVTNSGTLCATSVSKLWPELAATIALSGSVPAVQLATRVAPDAPRRSWVPEDAKMTLGGLQDFLKSIPTKDLDQIANLFGNASRVVSEHGFAIIQIHAAHGYLLSQLLTPVLNLRSDEYGRDPALLLRRCVEAIRTKAPRAVLDIRVSLHLGPDLSAAGYQLNFEELSRMSDIVSISAGHYELSRELIYPARRDGENVYLERVNSLAVDYPSVVWNCAGNIRRLSELSLPDNVTVSLGRPLLADPEFIEKSLSGNSATIRECDWNGACHYYTRGRRHIECPVSLDLVHQ
jgi:2,4-dienoyl-CoA reductase-like NADH-dependent reductase (Old Yellow Enzyme family)